MQIVVSPHFEMLFALAEVLGPSPAPRLDDSAGQLLGQLRRKIGPGFRRRLAAFDRETWLGIAGLPRGLPGPDAEAVIAGIRSLPEALAADDLRDGLADALQRFDRSGFAALWRTLRVALEEQASGLSQALEETSSDAVARGLGLVLEPGRIAGAVLVPAFLAPHGFQAPAGPGRKQNTVIAVHAGRLKLATLAPHPVPPSTARDTELDLAGAFAALGDATRYAIVSLIARTPMTGAELARRIGTSAPTMSHHLRVLRSAGLVLERPQGKRVLLSLDRSAIAGLSEAALAHFFGRGDSIAGETVIRRSRRRRR